MSVYTLKQQHEDAQALLGLSCFAGDAECARVALNTGADAKGAVFKYDVVNGTFNTEGPTSVFTCCKCTAAYVAALRGNVNTLGVILDAPGVDPNKGDTDNGDTPCHAACRCDKSAAVKMLLARGADATRVNKYGDTPFTVAILKNSTACLRALIEGAVLQGRTLDVNALMSTNGCWKGKTGLDIALDCNKAKVAVFLRDELGAMTGDEISEVRQAAPAMLGSTPELIVSAAPSPPEANDTQTKPLL